MQEELAPPSNITVADSRKRKLPIGVKGLFIAAICLKVAVMVLFSSGFENELFLPFVRFFVETLSDPWDFFLHNSVRADQFPYQPLMLYILSLSCAPLELLKSFGGWDNVLLRSFFFKLPTLIADISIALCLLKLFPIRQKQVLWLYFMSPIVLYACYMHSQLDLIPTALLFVSVYLLRKSQLLWSAILLGMAMATKLHVVAAAPLMLLYLFRNQGFKNSALYASLAAFTYCTFVVQFIQSPAFQQMVFGNPQQGRVFDVYIQVGDMRIIIPVLVAMILYGRFAMYAKINADLFDAFMTLIFSVFVLLLLPSPAWYVWTVPFLSLFMIKYLRRNRYLLAPYLVFNGLYLLFFVVFHKSDHLDLAFLDTPIIFSPFSDNAKNMVFTMLEASLLSMIILCYRAGIKSNSIYRHDYAFVIGIGGDSGAGKSTLLTDIRKLLQDNVVELEGDGDHKWTRGDEHWEKHTHLDPKANWLHRQANAILNLKRGRSVERVEYNHDTGQFTSAKALHAKDFIVLSGLHTFYLPKMRKLVDLKIFLDPAPDVHTYWKIQRDTKERGYSPEQVAAQMERRRTDKLKYIIPQREHADLLLHYFSNTSFVPDSLEGEVPDLRLSATMSSSVHLEELIQTLESMQILDVWDYDSDLSKQQIVLIKPIPVEVLARLANELVPNLDELVQHEITWVEGYRGTVQLFMLLVLSELMREKHADPIV